MAKRRLKLGILISGRGSNMLALLQACREPGFPAEVALVLSNRPDAPGLARAADLGIEAVIVDHKAFADKASFERALDDALRRHGVELICLAGFMRLLSPWFVNRWVGRILNIHPSLLPDYKGLNVHERVIADGQHQSGCTVHYVIPAMDEGPTILQRAVRVYPGDTPESLADRILEQEHKAYPEAVRLVALDILGGSGKETVEQGAAHRYEQRRTDPQEIMMDHHNTTDVDPAQLEQAEALWHNFMCMGKWAIVIIALILAGLLLVFVIR